MNNAILLRAPNGAHSLFAACHTSLFFYSLSRPTSLPASIPPTRLPTQPSIHPSTRHCAHPGSHFGTIKANFMLRGAFHHNGGTSETRKRLVGGIFNSCHSPRLHFYVPCLLAQLTEPNMLQRWAKANTHTHTQTRELRDEGPFKWNCVATLANAIVAFSLQSNRKMHFAAKKTPMPSARRCHQSQK